MQVLVGQKSGKHLRWLLVCLTTASGSHINISVGVTGNMTERFDALQIVDMHAGKAFRLGGTRTA